MFTFHCGRLEREAVHLLRVRLELGVLEGGLGKVGLNLGNGQLGGNFGQIAMKLRRHVERRRRVLRQKRATLAHKLSISRIPMLIVRIVLVVVVVIVVVVVMMRIGEEVAVNEQVGLAAILVERYGLGELVYAVDRVDCVVVAVCLCAVLWLRRQLGNGRARRASVGARRAGRLGSVRRQADCATHVKRRHGYARLDRRYGQLVEQHAILVHRLQRPDLLARLDFRKALVRNVFV